MYIYILLEWWSKIAKSAEQKGLPSTQGKMKGSFTLMALCQRNQIKRDLSVFIGKKKGQMHGVPVFLERVANIKSQRCSKKTQLSSRFLRKMITKKCQHGFQWTPSSSRN